MTSWLILRCSGRATLRLAESLAADGFVTWTPRRREIVRRARWNAKREVVRPLLPSFVFADAGRQSDLEDIEAAPGKRYPNFSLFRHCDRVPSIPDHALEPLRSAEGRAVPPQKRKLYARGSLVRVPEGAFAGMSGIVEGDDGKLALVCFGGMIRVKISSFLLRPDRDISDAVLRDIAA